MALRVAPMLPLLLVAGCVLVSPLGDGHQLAPSGSGADGGGSAGGGSAAGGEAPGGSTGEGGTTGQGGSLGALTASFGERPNSDHGDVTADTVLDGFYWNRNYGGSATGWVDYFPTEILIRFDLTALGTGVSVAGATLHLFTDTDEPAAPGTTTRVFEVLESWQEGSQDGSPGVANWEERTVGTFWATPGCGSPDSRSDIELATFQGAMAGQEHDVPLPATLVQKWIDDPSTNHGIILLSYEANPTYYVMSEHPSADRRPMLAVRYDPN